MRFTAGDNIDNDHCKALQHEFLRCHDAFKEFETFATIMIVKGKNRWISYKTYNAYSNFIHHLYEFMLGAYAREAGNTNITNKKGDERINLIEGYISAHTQRILTNRRAAIKNGTAPRWENDLSYYPERIPENFAKDFREYRNKISGHVTHERSSKLSLSDFYSTYHIYLYLLYRDALSWWGLRSEEFPDLKEITDFTVLVTEGKSHS